MLDATDRQRRVVICDDSPTVRHLLARIVESEPGLVLVGEAADGREAERLVLATRPDLVIMDIDMPHRRGDEVIAAVRRRGFAGGIVVFSGEDEQALSASVLLRLGADAIVRKGDVHALRAELAAVGRRPAPPLAA